MKYDWKKNDRLLYFPKAAPVRLRVPLLKYFKVSGEGDPNAGDDFQNAVEMLYTVSYTLKMLPKKHPTPPGYYEYSVFPLEGIWHSSASGGGKSGFVWDVMIRQPDFLAPEVGDLVRDLASRKKKDLPWNGLELSACEEGDCVQMLHVGSYDEEPRSFAIMDEFLAVNSLERRGEAHKEIYLNDPNRTAPGKLKTVLRYQVREALSGRDGK